MVVGDELGLGPRVCHLQFRIVAAPTLGASSYVGRRYTVSCQCVVQPHPVRPLRFCATGPALCHRQFIGSADRGVVVFELAYGSAPV